jgi:hypothetical protein
MADRRIFNQELTTHSGTLTQIATNLQTEFTTRKADGWKLTQIITATTNGSTVAILAIWELEGVL